MTASVLKQDPNTRRFKRTLVYFNTDTQYANFGEIPFIKPQNDTYTTDKRPKTLKNERKGFILFWLSFYSLFGAWKIVGMTCDFSSFLTVYLLFCGLIKGISTKICILCPC